MPGSFSRGSLPQNYLDSVTAGLTLPTPEPQYWFAKMAMAGRLSLAAIDAGMPTVQQFVTMNAANGAPVSPQLDEMARAADAYPGFIQVVGGFGLGRGDTIKFQRDIYASTATGYDVSNRLLKTDQTISTTPQQPPQTEDVPVVLQEFIGPYGVGGVQPYSIWDFDAKYRANKRKTVDIATKHLRRDYVVWLDRAIRSLFLAGSTYTWGDGITAVTDFAVGTEQHITLEQIFNARKKLSDREWAKFPNGRYMCLVPTSFNTQMLTDPEYKELSRYHRDQNQLFGYIGSVQDVDFFEITTLAQYSDNAGDIATYNSVSVPAGVVVNEAILVGPGAVGFGSALDPEARFADDTNYGTVAKMIWYAIQAFATLDVRGIERIPFQGADA